MVNTTIAVENEYLLSFGEKLPLSIEYGRGVKVWDETGKEYLDFTSGWAVTSLGHGHSVILDAMIHQSRKIMHNPNSGLTYSPARAQLLTRLMAILPAHLRKVFFTNSGAEANDAAIKLARKCTGKKKVISTMRSFHGRTIGTTSATGQDIHRDRFNVLVPYFEFVPFNDIPALKTAIDSDTAAVIVEPIQGEAGVRIPDPGYLAEAYSLCKEHGVLLIIDEIQTGFFRTGPAFACLEQNVNPDIMTMAKGIAGGFPFGAVAVSEQVALRIEHGDHGGTYNGNPLGCAIAAAVIDFMTSNGIGESVKSLGEKLEGMLEDLQSRFPCLITGIRGKGLLWAVDLVNPELASHVHDRCVEKGLLLNLKHGTVIRIFPALTIKERELVCGIGMIREVLMEV